MSTQNAGLEKAARKSLVVHFKAEAASYTGLAEDCTKRAAAHTAHAKAYEDSLAKSTEDQKPVAQANVGFHKSMAAQEDKSAKRATESAAKCTTMAEAFDSEDAEKIAKAVGLNPADFSVPETKTVPTPAATVVAAAGEGLNLDKAVSTGLEGAVTSALNRLFGDEKFGKQIEERLSGKILEKLGNAPAPTEVRSIAIPREGATKTILPGQTPQIDNTGVDPQFAHLVTIEDQN